jgi:hypothetical protein
MSLTLVAEMWLAVKESIISSDRSVVADNVISMLIDHDIGPDEIRKAFRGEGDIIDALKYYMNSEDWSDSEEDELNEDQSDFYDNESDEDDEDW